MSKSARRTAALKAWKTMRSAAWKKANGKSKKVVAKAKVVQIGKKTAPVSTPKVAAPVRKAA